MSAFTDQANWAKPEGAGYITTAPLSWEVGRIGSGLWVRVPVGFAFDVSVPWLLRWIFDPHDPRYRKAAALHDYTLSLHWDRVSAAAAFADALAACGVGRIERLAMVLAVIVWHWGRGPDQSTSGGNI